jgi:large subunit ribosomal protein L29
MIAKEIREKETGHLKEELQEKRKHLFNLRSQAVTEKLEDPTQLRKTRKEIAQMQTLLRQRELEAQPKPAKPEKAAGVKPPKVDKTLAKKSPVKRAALRTKNTTTTTAAAE